MRGSRRTRMLGFTLSAVLAVTPLTILAKEPAAKTTEAAPVTAAATSYAAYRAEHAQAVYPDLEIPVDIFDAEGIQRITVDGREGILTGEEDTVTWPLQVPETGWYQIRIEYHTRESKGASIERELRVDGELPFSEAAGITLQRVWEGSSGAEEYEGRFVQDRNGNELLPLQKEEPGWLFADLRDSNGYEEEPLWFYLTEGEHELTLVSLREPAVIGGITLYQAEKAPGYAEYRARHADAKVVDEYIQVIQGELASRKSDAMLVPITDRTSAATVPSDPAKIRLNTIGGSNWSGVGQWIEWDVTVPEDGLYRLQIKYRQNYLSGMTANRRLLVDGRVPFREAETLTFPYDRAWKSKVLGDGEQDYYLYLTAGETHTLRLECSLGGSAPLLKQAQEIVEELNGGYRKLVMYIGNDPDLNRDYKVDKALPEVMEIFERNLTALDRLSEDLIAFAGSRGDANVTLDNLTDMLRRMVKDARDVPKMMSTFRDNIGALGTWILNQSRQALEIDYLTLLGSESEPEKASTGFFQSMWFQMRAFLASFAQDYSIMSGEETQESIDVWVTTGRDQAQIIKTLISNAFTPETGIGVNLKLVSGQLLMATVAGTGPDVSLMHSSADVMNYALRSAVQDLNEYEGFDSTMAPFKESAKMPLSWGGKTYALPETQSFPVMFCRTDVLEELGLRRPNTWDELYQVIGELQKNNLEFGMPAGMTGYGLMLYQNGGQFYTDDGSDTGLFSVKAVETFKEWTRLYTNYNLPVEYDAANRFRSGEMPLLIADYSLYNTLSVFAPEIKGLWNFSMVPGTETNEGIDRSVAASVTGCILLNQSEKKNAAWQFMKWWVSTDTQVEYGRNLESVLGAAARYPTANTEAIVQLPWKTADYHVIESQWHYAKGIPEVPGAYYTSRHIENAFRRVINYGEDEREVIADYAKVIQEEIQYKRKELGLDG